MRFAPRSFDFQRLGKRLLVAAVFLSLMVPSGGLAYALGNNPLLSFILLGTFIVHMSSGPGNAERVWTLGLAALFRQIYAAMEGFHPYFGSALINWGGFLGLASVVVVVIQMARSGGRLSKNPPDYPHDRRGGTVCLDHRST